MNSLMKRLFLLAAIAAVMTIGANAQQSARVPAYRGLIERVQPSGDTLRTYLRGDEHKHWMMTEDGWQIKESRKGWFKYAKRTRNGDAVISCRKAHNEADRTPCEKQWLEKHGVKK